MQLSIKTNICIFLLVNGIVCYFNIHHFIHSRYILVSRPKEKNDFPLPSPLEEQLLAERFPGIGMKVYQHHTDLAVKSKKVSYCVEYTPFTY